MTITIKRRIPSALRSFLLVPGNQAPAIERLFTARADVVILDLEDGVAAAEKVATRALVVEALRRPRTGRGYVRINSFDTAWCMADLEAVVGPWLHGIVLPRVESADHLQVIARSMSQLEHARDMASRTLDLVAIIETAKGVAHASAIAAATPRLSRLALGGADYASDLDLEWSADEQAFAYARARLAHASRLAGLESPVDTAVLPGNDIERFRTSARNGRRMGFFGKLCLHPDQVRPCNEEFTPSSAQVAHARAVIAAFDAAEAQGLASVHLDGELIDYPVVYKAQRMVALAERLQSSGAVQPGEKPASA
jgi:citrate lyase subunit beta/citryl-CoA lyase